MGNYNPEFIRALAHGDKEAYEMTKTLSSSEQISLGLAVEEMRRNENIVPMSSGLSIYEQKESKYIDDDAVAESIRQRMELERENRERADKAREEFIQEKTRQAVERARCGLPQNGRFKIK